MQCPLLEVVARFDSLPSITCTLRYVDRQRGRGTAAALMSMVRAAWRGYTGMLSRRPYATSSATGGLVMLSGDSLAQHFEHRHHTGGSSPTSTKEESKHDKIRAAVMVGFSMGAFMPVNTLWYRNVVER